MQLDFLDVETLLLCNSFVFSLGEDPQPPPPRIGLMVVHSTANGAEKRRGANTVANGMCSSENAYYT
jgi:hypothetical protein